MLIINPLSLCQKIICFVQAKTKLKTEKKEKKNRKDVTMSLNQRTFY